MVQKLIKNLLNNQKLTLKEIEDAFEKIMRGEVSPLLTAGFLTSLRFSGETPDVILGAASVLRKHAVKVHIDREILADTCGTGGDNAGTFNISTAAALLAASAGVCVAKHGNRSVSSHCGSADILEKAGMKIEIGPEKAKKMLEELNFAFLFAPLYHPAMKQVAEVRKTLSFRTIFNIIGPLCNPAGANVQLLGVSSIDLLETIPEVLLRLGIKKAWVCHGEDGLDEITLTDKTRIAEVTTTIKRFEIAPEDFNFKRTNVKGLTCATAEENVLTLKNIFTGKEKGPKRDVVLLNTGAMLYLTGKTGTIKEGIELSRHLIETDHADSFFKKIIDSSHET